MGTITITITGAATATDARIATIMAATNSGGGELPLFLWLSPSFPVGAFAYSHGLEWAVEAGDIVDARSLEDWLADLLAHGAPRADAVFFAAAHRAAGAGDATALREANELAIALAGSAERRLETSAQGSAFVAAARSAWNCAPLALLPQTGEAVAYPVAIGATAAGHGVRLATALPAFVLAGLANLVSAAVRLGAIGQTDGQRVLAALLAPAQAIAARSLHGDLDAIGGCAFRSDVAALRHETQYSRLFRS